MTFLTNEVFETLAIQQLAITDDTLSVSRSKSLVLRAIAKTIVSGNTFS
ncbi:MAG: hypothetical protein RLZZ143_3517 [Cyanobacteriota bacterium]|jgi:hypothetical protein